MLLPPLPLIDFARNAHSSQQTVRKLQAVGISLCMFPVLRVAALR
jgi:hypothetical protein